MFSFSPFSSFFLHIFRFGGARYYCIGYFTKLCDIYIMNTFPIQHSLFNFLTIIANTYNDFYQTFCRWVKCFISYFILNTKAQGLKNYYNCFTDLGSQSLWPSQVVSRVHPLQKYCCNSPPPCGISPPLPCSHQAARKLYHQCCYCAGEYIFSFLFFYQLIRISTSVLFSSG